MQPRVEVRTNSAPKDRHTTPDLVDAIIAYSKENGISRRQIALMTGMDRARVQRILADKREVRYEPRISELDKISKAIGLNQYDALVSSEISHIIEENPDILTLLPFLSNVLNGLVSEIASEIQAADVIEMSACREIHARIMRKRIAKLVADELIRFFERQNALRDNLEHGTGRTGYRST